MIFPSNVNETEHNQIYKYSVRRNPHIQGTLDVYQAKLEGPVHRYTRVQNVNEWNVRADVMTRLTIGQKSMAPLKKLGEK